MGFYATIALVIFLVQTSQIPLAFSQGGPTTAQSPGTLPADWPSFNRDSSNSSFTPLKGEMDLKKPKLKWVKEIPDIDGDGKGDLVGSMRLLIREGNKLHHRVFCLE